MIATSLVLSLSAVAPPALLTHALSAPLLLAALMGLLMLAAAASDWESRSISNGLNLTMALLAVPFWLASGIDPWPGMAWQVAGALLVFLPFVALFYFGGMGGGDVKMIGALALWVPWPLLLPALTVMAFAGGLLSAAMLVAKLVARRKGAVEVPYGIAIAASGFWVLHQHYLNQFGLIQPV